VIEKINAQFPEAATFQQWRNTSSVVEWFKSLPDSKEKKFIKFDIVEFYPFIIEKLLAKVIEFAKTITAITVEEELIIWHSRKFLLFGRNSDWVKEAEGQFDLTMSSFDGAKI
jgi:hypothetical protein